MAQQIINNKYSGETGLSSRTKLNDMFTELYNYIGIMLNTKTSQIFTPTLNQTIFTVTNFTFGIYDDYVLWVGGAEQKANSSRVGQTITYPDAKEDQTIVIQKVTI